MRYYVSRCRPPFGYVIIPAKNSNLIPTHIVPKMGRSDDRCSVRIEAAQQAWSPSPVHIMGSFQWAPAAF